MREPAAMGRPREFDEATALTAIMDAFWAKGFDATSLSDLVAATGLKKGSLYAAFGDKRAMYHKALALYDRLWIDGTVRGLTAGGSPTARTDRFLQSAIDGAAGRGDDRGCFICNASIDQAPIDPAAERLVQASLDRLETALADVVSALPVTAERASAEGARQQARHMMAVYFGLRVLGKAGVRPEALDGAKRAALRTLVGG